MNELVLNLLTTLKKESIAGRLWMVEVGRIRVRKRREETEIHE